MSMDLFVQMMSMPQGCSWIVQGSHLGSSCMMWALACQCHIPASEQGSPEHQFLSQSQTRWNWCAPDSWEEIAGVSVSSHSHGKDHSTPQIWCPSWSASTIVINLILSARTINSTLSLQPLHRHTLDKLFLPNSATIYAPC